MIHIPKDLLKLYPNVQELPNQDARWHIFKISSPDKKCKLIKISNTYDFKSEFEQVASLSHPGLITVEETGFDQESQCFYLLREFVPGKTLESQSLDAKSLLELTLQISRTLFYLHQRGLAYLDLKPENIIWHESKSILIDTSLITRFDLENKISPEGGSPAYMAPESFVGGNITAATDQYSLGVLLYSLLQRQLPFESNSLPELIHKVLFENAAPLTPKVQTPTWFVDLVYRLLSKNPTDRFEDTNDLIRWINRLSGNNHALEPKDPLIAKAQKAKIRERNPLLFWEQTLNFLESKNNKTSEDYYQMAQLALRLRKDEIIRKTTLSLDAALRNLILAKFYLQKGDIGKAQDKAKKCTDLKNEKFLAERENILGRISYFQGDRKVALAHFKNASSFYREQKDNEGWINSQINTGNAYLGLNQSQEAQKTFETALQAAQQSSNPLLEARLSANLGLIHHQNGRWRDAFSYYQKSLETFELMGSLTEAIQTSINLSQLLIFFVSPLKAEEILDQARLWCEKINNPHFTALIHLSHGELLLAQHQPRKALLPLKQGLNLIRAQKNPTDLFHFYFSMVEALLADRQRERAQKYYERAEQALEEAHLTAFTARMEYLKILFAQESSQLDLLVLSGLSDKLAESKDWVYWLKLGPLLQNQPELQSSRNEITQTLSQNIPVAFRDLFLKKHISAPEPQQEVTQEEKMKPFPYERLMELNRLLASELDFNKLLEKIMEALVELTQAERGFILIPEGESLKMVFSKNFEKNEAHEDFEISRSLAQKVFEENRPIITIDALTDERFSQTASIHKFNIRSIICLPLNFHRKAMGVVYLDNRLRQSFFNKSELSLLEPFTSQIAIALNNAQLFEQKTSEIKKLKASLVEKEQEVALKYSYKQIIGAHPDMMKLFKMLDKVTDAVVPVAIQGESGVGKEMVAKAIHYNGKRSKSPFVSVNCAALPENLLEAELFGYVKGAFTGAHEDRPGLFEMADGGTLFLDEIADMPLAMQSKLLRVIQEGEVRPIGGKKMKKVDVRLISASNQSLKKLVSEKKFREDLFYRLYVAVINIPALRERPDDIPLLTKHFLKIYAEKNEQPLKKISLDAMSILKHYRWPGNVRELENFIYQLCVFGEGPSIEVTDLRIKEELAQSSAHEKAAFSQQIDTGHYSLAEAKKEFEKNEIERVLNLYQGHITRAAKHLQMLRPQLSRLIKYHQITRQ